MEIPIPARWKRLWDQWNLRGFIILSLSLQILLVLVAPWRKRTSRNLIIMSLWSAYLLADWAANFAVGLISSSQSTPANAAENGALLAFWAPFLLVHLGGPDTITAFALEDNELWLRHLFGLVFQCLAAVYVFLQTIPKNRLWIPTFIMFLNGIIKYSERTRSLYLASNDTFRDSMLTEPDPGPDYAKLMDEYYSKKEAKLPTKIKMIPEPDRIIKAANQVKKGKLTDLEVVQYAYRYFETFKGLVVDLIFSFRERNQSRDFFLERSAEDAFKVVEVELNFIYEVLFTKLTVVSNKIGYAFRLLSFISVIAAVVLFYCESKKGFDGFDVGITYTLLLGALTLDVIALIMLLFSDWTVVALKKSPDDNSKVQSRISGFVTTMLRFNTKRSTFSCFGYPIRIMHRRWAESMSTYNLISYCLNPRPKGWEIICDYLGLTSFLNALRYVKRERFTPGLRDFIFEELKAKSAMADDLETAKEVCSARGDWVLRIEGYGNDLLSYIVDVDYDESLLLWHIATELCFNDKDVTETTDSLHRDFAKLISDYMLYLLVMQPMMMSAVSGIGQIRFRDTCAEATKFFRNRQIKNTEETRSGFPFLRKGKVDPNKLQKAASKSILGVNTEVKPVTVKGDRSKSVLFDGSILAKDLDKICGEKKWEIMAKVWIELLSYAATHCRANSHAQQLSKGGELITIVWLLMAHFGLGDQFQINEGHARAKLIVGK